jgi:HSP20 family protein
MPNIPFPPPMPFSFQDVRNEFDRLLDRVWHVGLNTAPLDGQDWAPAIDVIEETGAFRVRVELPGMSAEEVDVSILKNVLTIRGCKGGATQPGEGRRPLRAECRYGSFSRKYEFAQAVSEDGISAECKRGVLEIVIPKKPEAAGKSVKVAGAE